VSEVAGTAQVRPTPVSISGVETILSWRTTPGSASCHARAEARGYTVLEAATGEEAWPC